LQIKGQIKAKFVKEVSVKRPPSFPREIKTDHRLKSMSSERKKERKEERKKERKARRPNHIDASA
jgi:hypothetical protein